MSYGDGVFEFSEDQFGESNGLECLGLLLGVGGCGDGGLGVNLEVPCARKTWVVRFPQRGLDVLLEDPGKVAGRGFKILPLREQVGDLHPLDDGTVGQGLFDHGIRFGNDPVGRGWRRLHSAFGRQRPVGFRKEVEGDEGIQVGEGFRHLGQGVVLIGALQADQEIAQLELSRILEGGVVECVLIFHPPLDESLVVFAVFRAVQRGKVEIDRVIPGTAGRLNPCNGFGAAFLDEGLGTQGDPVEFLQEGGFVRRGRKVLRRKLGCGSQEQCQDPCDSGERGNCHGVMQSGCVNAGYAR